MEGFRRTTNLNSAFIFIGYIFDRKYADNIFNFTVFFYESACRRLPIVVNARDCQKGFLETAFARILYEYSVSCIKDYLGKSGIGSGTDKLYF